VTLTNNGNVPAKGTATFTIVASTDDTPGNADDILLTPVTKTANVKNGKSKRIKLSVLLPTLPAGSYKFFVTTAFTGNLADTVTTNDSDISDNATTVA